MKQIKWPIALVGFPCSGKSTVGQLLALALDIPWLDSDQEITRVTGQPPAYWLKTQGEDAFRAMEHDWLQAWKPVSPCVLSTGGGLPCFKNNLGLLKSKALTIYLETDFATLSQRLQGPPSHALTHIYDTVGLRQLYQARQLIYQQAEIHILCRTPQETLELILASLD